VRKITEFDAASDRTRLGTMFAKQLDVFGRRSHQRLSFSKSCPGSLHVFRDVQLEEASGDRIVAMARHVGIAGQLLTMEILDSNGTVLDVCVTESRPVVMDGAVRHRLQLQIMLPKEGPFDLAAPAAVLRQQIPVHVLNCSPSGCLVEALTRLETGLVGSLHLRIDDRETIDDLKVVRCQEIRGSSVSQIGTEFLLTTTASKQSLRRIVTQRTGSARLEEGI